MSSNYNHTSSMELRSSCLICRTTVEHYKNGRLYKPWIKSFSLTLCEVLRLDHSFQPYLTSAVYCEPCLNTIRDIDFTLRNIKVLKRRLEDSCRGLESLVRDNYDSISQVYASSFDHSENPPANSYLYVLKCISESLAAEKKVNESEVDENIAPLPPTPQLFQHRFILPDPLGETGEDSDPDFNPKSKPNKNTDHSRGRASSRKVTRTVKAKAVKKLKFRQTGPQAQVRGTGAARYECNYIGCKFSTNRAPGISAHKRRAHKEDENHRCHCGKTFASQHYLKLHRKNPCSLEESNETTDPDIKVEHESEGEGTLRAVEHETEDEGPTETTKPSIIRPRKKQQPANLAFAKSEATNRCTFENCKFATKSMGVFKVHCRVHNGDETPFHCENCNDPEAKFRTRSILYDHKKRRCSANPVMKVEKVAKVRRPRFKNISESEPEETENGESGEVKTVFKCSYTECTFSTAVENRLQVHFRVHKGDPTPYHCDKCPRKFSNSKHLKLHKYRNCGNVVPCPVPGCDSVFPTKFCVKTHMSTKHYNIEKRTCVYCSKIYEQNEEEQYNLHIEAHNMREAEGRKFSCILPGCEKNFTNNMDLKTHVVDQHEERPLTKCDLCQAILANPTSLKRHMGQMHGPPNPSFKCEQCSYTARSPAGLIVHMNKHLGVKNYVCPHCDRKFAWPNGLRSHIRQNHTFIKPFKCTFEGCGKAFITNGKLRDHEETHSQIRSYYCDRCAKTFKAKKNLEQHFRYSHRTEAFEGSGRINVIEGMIKLKPERKPRQKRVAIPVLPHDSNEASNEPGLEPGDGINSSDFLTTELGMITGEDEQRMSDPPPNFTLASTGTTWALTPLPGQQFLNPLIHPENNTTFYYSEIQ